MTRLHGLKKTTGKKNHCVRKTRVITQLQKTGNSLCVCVSVCTEKFKDFLFIYLRRLYVWSARHF